MSALDVGHKHFSAAQLALAIITAGVGAWITLDAWSDIYRIAMRDEESSHIFLVPIVAGALVWIRRGRWRQCKAVGTWVGPLIVLLGWLLYSYSDMKLIQSGWHAGAIMIVIGCLLSVIGTDVLFKFLPAFMVLVFLIPVPAMLRQQISLPLQTATASVTEVILSVIGLEIQRAGNVLSINGTEVAIAEACNGLRMVFALTLVSYAFAFSTPLRAYVRALILLASPISAIVCNVIRLIPTVWLYGFYPNNVADNFHDISGWFMLPIAFLSLMAIVSVLRWALVPVHAVHLGIRLIGVMLFLVREFFQPS